MAAATAAMKQSMAEKEANDDEIHDVSDEPLLSSDGDDDNDDFDQSGREDCKVNGIALEEEGEVVVVVDEEDVDDKFNQLLLSSSTSDDRNNDPLQLKALPELSDPKS